MIKRLLYFVLISFAWLANASEQPRLWLPLDEQVGQETQLLHSNAHTVYYASTDQIYAQMKHPSGILPVPLPDGSTVNFQIQSNSAMSPKLAEKYPAILSYDGTQIGNSDNWGRFNFGPKGFTGVVEVDGKRIRIDSAYFGNFSPDQYVSTYEKVALGKKFQFTQYLPLIRTELEQADSERKAVLSRSIPARKRYRLAVSASGEYTDYHGGTVESGLAAIVTMVNRVNQVYQVDMNIEFELIGNNDLIIFTDADTDPFDNTDQDINVNQQVIDDAIGFANYDVGHIVNTGGGGLAVFEGACTQFKAEGVTGSSRPENDFFWIDFVAHELGHQFGANHTFSGTAGACGGNEDSNSAYEVGSGSTIMSYAGLCGTQNVQNVVHDNFHIHSLDEMTAFIASGAGATCGTVVGGAVSFPEVNAGSDYTIPANTPFTLTGSATDESANALTYSWEQFDLERNTPPISGPLFRVFAPTGTPSRTFPQLSSILERQTRFDETLPSDTRVMNFRLVVRNTEGGVADDGMVINVETSDGFEVTQLDANTRWDDVEQSVTWQTGDSELPPVSCSEVDILLSSNGGNTFDQVLLSNTANDGQAQVTLPSLQTQEARIKIECSDNVFFAVNIANFEIDVRLEPIVPVIISQQEILTNEDTSITIIPSMFSFEDQLTVDFVSTLEGQNYTLDGNRVLPDLNFNGELTVLVTATLGDQTSEAFLATVNILPINDSPEAVNDSLVVDENDGATSINVVANDIDVDGDVLSITRVSYSGSGTVTFSETEISYRPAQSFVGSEEVIYEVSDGNGGVSEATLTIQVNQSSPTPAPTPTPDNGSGSSGGSMSWFTLVWLLLAIYRRKMA